MCEASNAGDTVRVEGGIYLEPFRFTQPAVLSLQRGGSNAVFGRRTDGPKETLSVLTYNTHLWGDWYNIGIGPPRVQEDLRATAVGHRLPQANADIIGLQEVWDDELYALIAETPWYAWSIYTDDEWDIDAGMGIFSRNSHNDGLGFLAFENLGIPDNLSDKGAVTWITTKGPYTWRIWVTHTDASLTCDDCRWLNLAQLGTWVKQHMDAEPGVEVIVMGDFNINGDDEIARDRLANMEGWRDLNDAFMHAPCFSDKMNAEDDRTLHTARNAFLRECLGDNHLDRYDQVFYSTGRAFNVLPVAAEVPADLFRVWPPIEDDDCTTSELSDHFPVQVDFEVWDL